MKVELRLLTSLVGCRDLAANSEKQLNDQIAVLNGDKEELQREIGELKNHLTALEEQKEHQKRELGEAHRNIKEGMLLVDEIKLLNYSMNKLSPSVYRKDELY